MTNLYTPFSLHTLTLNNRIVMAPMTRNKSPRHVPGIDVASYYKRRAMGGVGLIITEGTCVGHKAAHGYPDVPSFFGKEPLSGWRRVVQEVHEAGGKIFPQLWHVGSVRQRHQCKNSGVDNPKATCVCESNVPGFAPSPIAHPYVKEAEIPHEMSHKDIQDVVTAFAKAADDAKKIGFDGVEIHGAHGYLIDQFFWDYTNRRKDLYGVQTFENRTRFAVEIIKAVRQKVGPHFPIDFRFSQWKLGSYDAKLCNTPEELEAFLTPLANAGVDIFHCSTRRFWEPEFAGSQLNLAGWTKKITGKPTITVGSVGLDTDFIDTMKKHVPCHLSTDGWPKLLTSLHDNEFDLVAVGRALLADPSWAQKVKDERYHDITLFSQDALKILH